MRLLQSSMRSSKPRRHRRPPPNLCSSTDAVFTTLLMTRFPCVLTAGRLGTGGFTFLGQRRCSHPKLNDGTVIHAAWITSQSQMKTSWQGARTSAARKPNEAMGANGPALRVHVSCDYNACASIDAR